MGGVWWPGGDIVVAVKKMGSSQKALDEYNNVVELEFLLSEDNLELVIIFARCIENVLIYQYMAGGDLGKYLFGKMKPLGWSERVKISVNVAKGLELLRGKGYVHRDVKPSHILLHENMHAKVGGFGRIALDGQSFSSTRVDYNVAHTAYCTGIFGYGTGHN